MPGHLFQCNPEDEVTTRRGTDTPVASSGKTRRFQIQLDKCPVNPRTTGEASGVPFLNTRRGLTPVSTLQRPCNQSQKWRGTLRFLPQLEKRPSSIEPNSVVSRAESFASLETRPDSPGEFGMQPRDTCRPCSGTLCPRHKPR